jgi:TonB family protein
MPRQLYALAATASIALHVLVAMACCLLASKQNPSTDSVVTVRLIASPPVIASRPASNASAHLQDEDPETIHRDTVTTPEAQGQLAHPAHIAAKALDGSAALHSASRAKLHPLPQPDIPAIPSRPLDENENVARHSREEYSELLAKRLSGVTKYPELAVTRHDEGIVILHLSLDRAGHVLACEIVSSSGWEILDEEVLRMVKVAEPFPPFPDSWTGPTAEFTIPITFALN